MLLRTKLHGKTYEFPDIRLLMGKANEEKSGDRLAGVAAETAAERAAARLVLAEVPLWVLRENPAAPYDQDEVTRVIHDALNERVYGEIKDWTVGQLREWILADTTTPEMIRRVANGLTAEMIAAVVKLMSNLDLIYGASKLRVTAHCNNTIGAAGHALQPQPAQSPHGFARRHPRRGLRGPLLRLRRLGDRHQPGGRLLQLGGAAAGDDLRRDQDVADSDAELRAFPRHHADEVHGGRRAGGSGLPVAGRFAAGQ
jgi:hypothetical protein